MFSNSKPWYRWMPKSELEELRKKFLDEKKAANAAATKVTN
jgi:hypothetical protein